MLLANLHCVSKNVPPLTCYNFDIQHPIMTIFGRNVTEKVGNQMMSQNGSGNNNNNNTKIYNAHM